MYNLVLVDGKSEGEYYERSFESMGVKVLLESELNEKNLTHVIWSRAVAIAMIAFFILLSKSFMHLSDHAPIYHLSLFDIGHKLIPPLDKVFSYETAEWIWWFGSMSMEAVFAVALLSIVFSGKGIHLGFALAIGVLLHSIFWHATILPLPNNILWQFPIPTGEIPKPDDFWFSGHVAYTVMLALAASGQKLWIRLLCWAYVLAIVLLVLSTRVHYTIDVIGSFFVAYTVYDMLGHVLVRHRIANFFDQGNSRDWKPEARN